MQYFVPSRGGVEVYACTPQDVDRVTAALQSCDIRVGQRRHGDRVRQSHVRLMPALPPADRVAITYDVTLDMHAVAALKERGMKRLTLESLSPQDVLAVADEVHAYRLQAAWGSLRCCLLEQLRGGGGADGGDTDDEVHPIDRHLEAVRAAKPSEAVRARLQQLAETATRDVLLPQLRALVEKHLAPEIRPWEAFNAVFDGARDLVANLVAGLSRVFVPHVIDIDALSVMASEAFRTNAAVDSILTTAIINQVDATVRTRSVGTTVVDPPQLDDRVFVGRTADISQAIAFLFKPDSTAPTAPAFEGTYHKSITTSFSDQHCIRIRTTPWWERDGLSFDADTAAGDIESNARVLAWVQREKRLARALLPAAAVSGDHTTYDRARDAIITAAVHDPKAVLPQRFDALLDRVLLLPPDAGHLLTAQLADLRKLLPPKTTAAIVMTRVTAPGPDAVARALNTPTATRKIPPAAALEGCQGLLKLWRQLVVLSPSLSAAGFRSEVVLKWRTEPFKQLFQDTLQTSEATETMCYVFASAASCIIQRQLETLQDLVGIAACLPDAGKAFLTTCERVLSRRLLKFSSAPDVAAEAGFLDALAAEFGNEAVARTQMRWQLRDRFAASTESELHDDAEGSARSDAEQHRAAAAVVEVQVVLLKETLWPSQPPLSLRMPATLAHFTTNFMQRHMRANANRKLTWAPRLATAEVLLHAARGTKRVFLAAQQAAVLLAIDKRGGGLPLGMTVRDIVAVVGTSDKAVERVVASMSLDQCKLVVDDDSGPERRFAVNAAFTHKQRRLTAPAVSECA